MFAKWPIVFLLPAAAMCAAAADARLAEAAKRMDRAAVSTLLKQHADVNATEADGSTALHWAVEQDDLETARLLIGAGADVKAPNRYGVTPLSVACTNGNGKIVELLLKAGADPNTVLPGGETALMTAARTGKIEAVQTLLSHGADIKAKEPRRGQNALMWAAAEGNVEAIEALIKAGADLHARSSSGFTAFLFAVREGRIGAVRALLKAGNDVNETIQGGTGGRRGGGGGAPPAAGTSALVMACDNAHYELASVLLDAGADPNANVAGLSALHVITNARKPGGGDNNPPPEGSGNMTSLEMVKKLVAKGANINMRMTRRVNLGLTSLNTNGATPFFLAAKTADAELMRLLASLGADPKIGNVDNATPLMAAAGLGTRSPGEDAGTEPEVSRQCR
jgi:ankyrin repeat protein